MDKETLDYYESELRYLRETGAEFARHYPKVAQRLLLEPDRCADPHVERLLEGFAFLAGRVRRKIDDDFPELSQALLESLYPHSLRPVPSMSIVQFLPGPGGGRSTGGETVDAWSELRSKPVEGISCRFRTAYPVTLWPLDVTSARLRQDRLALPNLPNRAKALLEIALRRPAGLPITGLPFKRLRFHIDGDAATTHAVYTALFNQCCGVAVRGKRPDGSAEVVELPADAIKPVGFEGHEGMFPDPARSFAGYRLIQEYFAFPEKFLFFDVEGLDRIAGKPWGDSADLLIFLNGPTRPQVSVTAENFRLGCTPVVNMFSTIAQVIPLTRHQSEYRVIPDVQNPIGAEVHSIDSVTSAATPLDEVVTYEPLYTHRHGSSEGDGRAYWFAYRRPSAGHNDEGTEVYLSLVDPGLRPARRQGESLTVRVTLTNRDLATKLPVGGAASGVESDFELASAGPVSRVRCLRKPTPSYRPGLGRGAHWRLISHLSLNHLSLSDDPEGDPEALRALLRLYEPTGSAASGQQVEGVMHVSHERTVGRVVGRGGVSACKGLRVKVVLDESRFVGGGVFLFASVLERFLGLYTSINSFTQLEAWTRQPEAVLKRWQPRSGARHLL